MLPQYKQQFRRPVSPKSWNPQTILGADTETLDGFAKMLTLERATGSKSTRFAYKAHTSLVNSFQEIIEAFLENGFIYSKTVKAKNGAMTRQWYYSTPNYFFYNLKFDFQAISKYLTDEQLDEIYIMGELKMPFTYKDCTGEIKIRYLDGKYVSMEFKDIYITSEMKVKTDNKKLFTDRFNAIIKSTSIKQEAERYGITTATVRKWTKGSQPRDGNIREAIMKRGLRLVGEVITKQTVKCKVSPIELWDIAQFYNKMRLNTAAKVYLNKTKMETCFDGSTLDASKFGDDVIITGDFFPYDSEDYHYESYWDYYQEDILKYADIDAELCGQLARRSRNEYVNAGVRFKKPYSPANIGQQALMSTGYNETINLIESDESFKRLMAAGEESYHGGRFEVSEIGYYKNMVGVDLCSAYWLVLANLPSLISSETVKGKRVETVNGTIVEGDDIAIWNEWLEVRNSFTIGFIDVEVEFREAKWYPLIDDAKTTLIAPRLFKGKICAEEYIEMLKWNPISVKTGSFIYHEASEESYPFMDIIKHCFDKKQNATGSERNVWKQVGSSLYGKTIQAIDDIMGSMYHSAYASTITGATRSRLAEICRLNDCTPLMMATDGLLFKKEDLKVIPKRPSCAKETPDVLGEWEIEGEGECLIVGSGVYTMIIGHLEPPQQVGYEMVNWNPDVEHKTTYRGTAKSFILRSEHDDWFNFCQANADKESIAITRTRPMSLKEVGYKRRLSKARHEKDETQELITYADVNIFKEEPLRMNPCTESNKRIPTTRPTTFGDLLTNQYVLNTHESVDTANGVRDMDLEMESLLEEIMEMV